MVSGKLGAQLIAQKVFWRSELLGKRNGYSCKKNEQNSGYFMHGLNLNEL